MHKKLDKFKDAKQFITEKIGILASLNVNFFRDSFLNTEEMDEFMVWRKDCMRQDKLLACLFDVLNLDRVGLKHSLKQYEKCLLEDDAQESIEAAEFWAA